MSFENDLMNESMKKKKKNQIGKVKEIKREGHHHFLPSQSHF